MSNTLAHSPYSDVCRQWNNSCQVNVLPNLRHHLLSKSVKSHARYRLANYIFILFKKTIFTFRFSYSVINTNTINGSS